MPLVKPAWITLIILLFQRLWANTGGTFIYSEELKPVSYALSQIAQVLLKGPVQLRREFRNDDCPSNDVHTITITEF